MAHPKETKTRDGKLAHFSVGAIIERNGKYLLIDRAAPPPGFACVAGHVDEGEATEYAVAREVKEEVGLAVNSSELLFEEELDWNWCNKGVTTHYWRLYQCETEGEVVRSTRETKSADWYAADEIKRLNLEPVWEYWLKKLSII